jgi:hypothetical protein
MRFCGFWVKPGQKIKGLSCEWQVQAFTIFIGMLRLAVDGYQLLLCRSNHGRPFGCFSRGFGVERVKDRGANENGKEEGHNVHSCAEQEGLPAANGVKSGSIHWILRLVFKRLRISTP